jgi:hypothetical protein
MRADVRSSWRPGANAEVFPGGAIWVRHLWDDPSYLYRHDGLGFQRWDLGEHGMLPASCHWGHYATAPDGSFWAGWPVYDPRQIQPCARVPAALAAQRRPVPRGAGLCSSEMPRDSRQLDHSAHSAPRARPPIRGWHLRLDHRRASSSTRVERVGCKSSTRPFPLSRTCFVVPAESRPSRQPRRRCLGSNLGRHHPVAALLGAPIPPWSWRRRCGDRGRRCRGAS